MSTLNVSNITDGTDTVETGYVVNGSAKAWVNFNGTGTVAIRNGLNVSSITDYGAGTYGPNYTNSFNAADYASVTAMEGSGGYAMRYFTCGQLATTSMVVRVQNTAVPPVGQDNATCQLSFHGDLA